MSLLEKATLITTPTAHSNGTLHSIKGGAVADFDVVRGSAATRVNAEGLIEDVVATNIPRIDYTDGTASILLEPLSTNLIVNSELNNIENIVVSAVSHTISFYGTGSITLSGTHSATLSGTGANDRVSLTFTPSAGTLICTDSGSVDKKQIEALPYSTSYIPTSGQIATRLADSVTGAGDATTFNSTEGVLYAEVAALADDGTNRYITLNSGFKNDSVRIYYNSLSQNQISIQVRSSNAVQAIYNYTLSDVRDFVKVAILYKLNEFKMYVNGSLVYTDTSGLTPIGLSELDFDSAGAESFYGKVKSVITFNTALTDAELTCLTTI